jgi:hypothetical protein
VCVSRISVFFLRSLARCQHDFLAPNKFLFSSLVLILKISQPTELNSLPFLLFCSSVKSLCINIHIVYTNIKLNFLFTPLFISLCIWIEMDRVYWFLSHPHFLLLSMLYFHRLYLYFLPSFLASFREVTIVRSVKSLSIWHSYF